MKITPANLEPRISDLLGKGVPANWQPSGLDRNAYLDLMEPILQQAATWQDAQGAIIDPVEKKEHGQTSCRFVAPGAILLSAGRGENLRERVLRGMDWCCQRLVSGEAQSPDFWMRELMTAWSILKEMDPQRAQGWRKNIFAVDQQPIYWQVSRD